MNVSYVFLPPNRTTTTHDATMDLENRERFKPNSYVAPTRIGLLPGSFTITAYSRF